MKITVEIKTIYGIDKIYPVCINAAIFANLTGNKTLTDEAIKGIEALGYEIEYIKKYNKKVLK